MKKKRIIFLSASIFILIVGLVACLLNNPKYIMYDGVKLAITLDGHEYKEIPDNSYQYKVEIVCEDENVISSYEPVQVLSADGSFTSKYEMKLTFANVPKGGTNCSVNYTTVNSDNYLESLLKTKVETVNTTNNNGYRYSGKNPNNWIWFNDELWRIIGSVPVCTSVSFTGVSGSCSQATSSRPRLVKIIRADSIGGLVFDASSTSATVWGNNILHTLLNSYYWGQGKAMGQSPCVGYSGAYANCNYNKIGIAPSGYYGQMVAKVNMNVGTVSSTSSYISSMYTSESSKVSKATYVGLMNISDYGYATSGITYTSVNPTQISSYEQNNWLYGAGYSELTMTPQSTSYVMYITQSGGIASNYAYTPYVVRPVVYLNDYVYIIDGDGSATNPYIVGLIDENNLDTVSVFVNSTNDSYGTVTPINSQVKTGESLTVTLQPKDGHRYVSNTCGGTVSGNTMTISNITAAKTCAVTFEPVKYTVSVSSNNTSYGTVSPTSSTVNHGGSLTVTLSPKSGYNYSSNTCGGTVSGNTMTISNITAAKTCTVTFKTSTKLAQQILSDNDIVTTGEGLYKETANTQNNGTTYYYSGAVTNNNVQFGTDASGNKLYWKIIRINEDGSIRLIYNGTSATATGTATEIGRSDYNYDYNDLAYAGYMFGELDASSYDVAHSPDNESLVLTVINEWFEENLNDYYDYLSLDTGFCNDRQVQSGQSYGEVSGSTLFVARNRTNSPIFKCTQENDLFTSTESSVGNAALTYPVGLITFDEVTYAGTTSSYLVTGSNYWTMTPALVSSNKLQMFRVSTTGSLEMKGAYDYTSGVRPVINLKSDVILSDITPSGCVLQDGSTSCPYVVGTMDFNSVTKYTVTVNSNNTSLGTVTPNSKTVASGENAAFEIVEAENGEYLSNTCGGTLNGNILTIPKVTANKTCTVNFKSVNAKLSVAILADNKAISDASLNFGNTHSETGLYYTNTNTEGGLKTYYFRGGVTNNFVQFGTDHNGNKLYWRIIRINEDGSIRLIYNGTSTSSTGSDTVLPDSIEYSTSSEDLAVKFYDEDYGNSDVLSYIGSWYDEVLYDYDSYISYEATFCNDTEKGTSGNSGTTWLSQGMQRLVSSKQPQFKCTSSGLLTGNDMGYPIGLISADEVVYAGGSYNSSNSSYYLRNGTNYWTMTAFSYTTYYSMFRVESDGSLKEYRADNDIYVRPVINLKSTVRLSSLALSGCNGTQNGTPVCPYVIGAD